jgi:hypothetical protein
MRLDAPVDAGTNRPHHGDEVASTRRARRQCAAVALLFELDVADDGDFSEAPFDVPEDFSDLFSDPEPEDLSGAFSDAFSDALSEDESDDLPDSPLAAARESFR